ncbi:MFS transporter [Naasia lichenicola]|uniref:MFS transporter n=1 Tax=Naasia lichenicola TaxID=2565933 RepID=A0A4S4FS67_9MICO|nr:MFS transporter [Naasia lichenicola]THG32316.1 MFS transporter [Naasia lichenicola]
MSTDSPARTVTGQPAATTVAPPGSRAHARGFWVIAVAFLAVMAFSTIPTPLYALYQARDGFPTWIVTVIFGAYAVGVAASLYLVGHISDWAGRRPMILVAVALELLSAVVFLVWPDVPGLLVARFISGIGVGALTATATAHLSELRAAARPGSGPGTSAAVSTVANIGGLALGPLIGGLLATFAPAPLTTPYLVFLVVLALAVVGIALVPETVIRAAQRPAYRPQRLVLPAEGRAEFSAAGAGVFAAFAIFGLFTALAPSLLAGQFGVTSRIAAGLVPFAVFASAAITQVVLARLTLRRQLSIAVASMIAGLAALGVSVLIPSLALFVISGIVAGAGVGLLFRASLGVAASLVAGPERGGVLAALFLIAYVGLAVPVFAVGLALSALSPVVTLIGFVVLVGALVLVSGIRMIRRLAA